MSVGVWAKPFQPCESGWRRAGAGRTASAVGKRAGGRGILPRLVPSCTVLLALVPVLVCSGGDGGIRPGMTFRCSFDGSVVPEIHAGSRDVVLDGVAEYVPGVAGDALVVGDGKAQIRIPRERNYSLAESSVTFWVKPLDWRGDDKHFHIFFQASSGLPGGKGTGARLIYKYMVPGRFLHLVIPDDPIPYVNFQGACYADIGGWEPGQWHHVVGAWRGAGLTLYLDGKPAGGMPYTLMPMDMGDELMFGDRTWAKGRDSRSVVDELMVFDRSLNEAEVALLHGRHDPAVQRQKEELGVVLRPFFLSRRLEVYADTWAMGEGTSVTAALFQGDRVVARTRGEGGDRHGLSRVGLVLTDASPGQYEVRVEAVCGDVRRQGVQPLAVPPDPPWLGSRIGVSDRVPMPWTDMRTDEETVYCWNREYVLGEGPFCSQVLSAGRPLLSGPVELRVRSGGTPLVWGERRLAVQEATPSCVRVASRASAGGADLAVGARIEYDGMVWFDAVLTPGPDGLAVDRIVLDIPVRGEWARFWQGMLPRSIEKHAGEIADDQGALVGHSFVPTFWVGCDERGIQWFTETSEPWDDPERKDSVGLVREGDTVYVRVVPVASGCVLREPWRFSFGIQASPVRPVVPDWRKYRLSGAPGTAYLVWTNPEDMIWFGYPRARDPEALAKKIADHHRRRVTVVPYSCPFLLSLDSPESRLYGPEWLRLGEGDSGSADVVRMGGCAQYVPPGSPHYADFTVWAHETFVREIGWDGLYFDHSTLKALDFAPAGCGYTRDGVRLATYPVRATREMLKRMYVMLKEKSPEHWLMIHTSGQTILPLHGFADIRAVGEDLGMRLSKQPNYHEILTEAEWRVLQSGHAYGFSNVLLPKLPSKVYEDPEPTEQLMGLILLHDLDLWGGYSHGPSRGAMRTACDRFGIIGAEYVPFWRSADMASVDPACVRVSVYRQRGRAMLVLVNRGGEPVRASVTVVPASLGVGRDAPWRDLIRDKELTVGVPLDIGPGNYRLLQVGGGE